MKKNTLLSLSLVSAIAPFFCCWGPAVLTTIAGVSGAFSWFSWLHPMRPYLYAVAFLSLGFTFYKTYPPKRKTQSCENCKNGKNKNMPSKIFLWITTLVVLLIFITSYYRLR